MGVGALLPGPPEPGCRAAPPPTTEATRPSAKLARVYRSRKGDAGKWAGMAVARFLGLEGREGGWIYNTDGKPVVQGYANLAHAYGARYDREAGGVVLSENGLRKLDGYWIRRQLLRPAA